MFSLIYVCKSSTIISSSGLSDSPVRVEDMEKGRKKKSRYELIGCRDMRISLMVSCNQEMTGLPVNKASFAINLFFRTCLHEQR